MFKAGDRIAQFIIGRNAEADAREVDDLARTRRGKMGFGSSDPNHMRSLTATEGVVKICFLHAETVNNQFFSGTDIGYHTRILRERAMFSSAHVNAAFVRRTDCP